MIQFSKSHQYKAEKKGKKCCILLSKLNKSMYHNFLLITLFSNKILAIENQLKSDHVEKDSYLIKKYKDLVGGGFRLRSISE